MRWFAAATISLTLLGAVFGCGSSDGGGLTEIQGGAGGSAAGVTAGSSGTAGTGNAHAGSAGASAGSSATAGGGDAGSSVMEGGSAGADESLAGAAQGGSSGSGGNGGSGGSAGAAPVPTIPSPPTTLTLQVLSSTSVQLGWTDNASNETGYNLYWSTTSDKPATPNAMVLSNVSVATADSLVANQEYNFWVEAYNDLGTSADITGKATPIPVPAAPTGLVVAPGPADAVLTWSDAAQGETGYRVFVSTTNTQPTDPLPDVIAANATTFTVTSAVINPYTKYYYWVVAYNAVGSSAPATGSATTGVAPIAPTGVVVDAKSSVWSVSVSWIDNSTNSSSFNVYWSTDDTKPALPGANVSDGSNAYKMKAVQGNKTYRFWIEATNAIGTSTPTKGTAGAATYELAWTDLYYDIGSNTIRQAVQDTFGLLTDAEPAAQTNLYGYHAASSTALPVGTGSALNPGINWNPTSAGIDLSATQYFYSEARTALGSTFSVRSLAPVGNVTNFTVTPSNLSMALNWSAATSATAYQIFKGSTSTFANATSLGTVSGTSYTLNDLNPGTPMSFWVRALGVGFNGPGMPSPTVSKDTSTTGTSVGNNLAKGKTAVASSNTADAGKVVDGDTGSRWQAAVSDATQWIYVNLGDANAAKITHVKLVWEGAYATSYDIQLCAATCDDNVNVAAKDWAWQTVHTVPTTTLSTFPSYQMISLTDATKVGQFVRMRVKTLSSTGATYGASLYEFEVFSAP